MNADPAGQAAMSHLASVQALLDAQDAHVALVNTHGVIVAVNRTWREFGEQHGLNDERAGVGQNYLQLCDQVQGDGSAQAAEMARQMRCVLRGLAAGEPLEYPCHSSGTERWFTSTITPIPLSDGPGAMVAHTLSTNNKERKDLLAAYRVLFDANPQAMWIYDLDTLAFLDVNQATVERYGYTKAELLQMTLLDIRPSDTLARLKQTTSGPLKAFERSGVWTHKTKSGRLLKVDLTSHAVTWKDGRRARMVLAEDITPRVEAQSALALSELRFNQMAMALEDLFWLSDVRTGELLYVSPAYERIWGYTVESLMNDPAQWLRSIDPEDRDRVALAFSRQTDEIYDVEYTITSVTGERKRIAAKASPIADSDGQTHLAAGLARDITKKHEQDARLKLLEVSINRLNDIVLITEAEPFDKPGPRIVFVNDAFEKRTGYSRAEVIGRTPRILQGAETQRDALDRIRTALEAWQPVREELINYTKDGTPFWLELDIVPLANDHGWYTHWVAVERDITERKNFERHRDQSQRLESLGQLTGGVAHDFNNLLTVIMGNAEVLLDRVEPGTQEYRLIEMINQAAERSSELTQRLLAFARKQPLHPSVVDVAGLVTGMRELLMRSIGESVAVTLNCAKDTWPALVDAGQLENALLNLACWRRWNIDQLCRLNFDQGLRLPPQEVSCG